MTRTEECVLGEMPRQQNMTDTITSKQQPLKHDRCGGMWETKYIYIYNLIDRRLNNVEEQKHMARRPQVFGACPRRDTEGWWEERRRYGRRMVWQAAAAEQGRVTGTSFVLRGFLWLERRIISLKPKPEPESKEDGFLLRKNRDEDDRKATEHCLRLLVPK